MAIRCGTCAWADHHDFYPKSIKPADRLAYYARYFSVVEIDSSFYRIPKVQTVADWVKQTPENFVFDMKAYQSLTRHTRGKTAEDDLREDSRLFHAAAEELRQSNKLGMLLFQFPPWFVYNPANVDYLHRIREDYSDFTLAIEFRNRSWWNGDRMKHTLALLRQLHAVNVVCDEPQVGNGTIPFVPDITNSAYVMFRLHGRNAEMWYQKGLESSQQRFDYLYSPDELKEFLPAIRTWLDGAKEVHILMNNNQGDYAVRNALDWLDILQIPHRRPERPHRTQQLTLFGDPE